MDEKLLVEKLLQKHGLSSMLSSNSAAWESFIADVTAVIVETQKIQKRQEQLLEISYQEVNEWWNVITARESIIKSILDASTDIIITIDSQGNIEEFNHGAEKVFGVSKRRAVGTSVFDLIGRGPFYDELRQIITGDSERSRGTFGHAPERWTVCRRDGASFDAEIVISTITQGKNRIYPLYIRDLTEQIESQRVLEESRTQAAQAAKMASLGEMAGGIAHEINTPLNIFTMYAEILRDCARDQALDTPTILDAADTIENTATRISKIVQGLRSFSRDDSQDSMTSIAVIDIVNDTLALCRERFSTHGISIRVTEIDPTWKVRGRPTSLSQVLLNLLNNAHDAIETMPERWIEVGAVEKAGMLHINVTDSGTGISKELAAKIMSPFFTTKPIGKGTGLGLSISKGIIEKHAGQLIYDSSCGNTRFVMSLPRFVAEEAA
ncbi:MAG: PAS domain S-box protein [Bdellovibrionaceae bacterium]|nr:PAS domain S-box protein [Pseudobdellovibrionaceae bacterium]